MLTASRPCVRLERAAVLVTGAGGFIGGQTVRTLMERGATVTALVGPPGADVREPPTGTRSVRAHIADRAALVTAAAGVDVVVHLAGPPGVARSFDHASEYADAHVMGTLSVLEACRQQAVARLVHISSAEVYGEPEESFVRETHPLRPRSPYAAAKASAEHFVHAFAAAFGIQAAILRPFSVYGPGQRPASLVGTLVDQALHDDAVVVADLRPVRDYCFVDDVVEAIVRACVADLPAMCTLNIGTGRCTSVAEVARLIATLAGTPRPLREEPARRRPPQVEIFRLVADPAAARTRLGWEARTSLEAGLAQTLRRATVP